MSVTSILLSPYRQPDPRPLEQGNPSVSTSPLMREYEWDSSTDVVKVTKGYKVTGDGPRSRYPHAPVDPINA